MTRGIRQQQWRHKASEGYNLAQQSHRKDPNYSTVMMRHGFCEKPDCWATSSPDSTGREWDICVPSGGTVKENVRGLRIDVIFFGTDETETPEYQAAEYPPQEHPACSRLCLVGSQDS